MPNNTFDISRKDQPLQPIKNGQQYEDALARADELIQKNIKPDAEESDELEILSILIKEYENKYYPIPKSNPLEAIKHQLEQMNMSEAELSKMSGLSIQEIREAFREMEIERDDDP